MKLVATRHAETNYNVVDLVNYDPAVDVYLTPKGVAQAQDLAEQLKDFQFDAVYVSRLKRTQQTAEIINRYHGLDLVVDELLDDTRNGFEGRPYSEAKGWRDAQPDPVTAKYMNKFESVADMTNRVKCFLKKLAHNYQKDETILIVTSSHLIKQLRMLNGEITIDELLRLPAKHATYYSFEVEKLLNSGLK